MRRLRGSVTASFIPAVIASVIGLAGCAVAEEIPTGDVDLEAGMILGQNQANAGRNCSHLFAAGASTGNGIYWIDPDRDSDHSNAVRAYCDMTTDGGGWTLLTWTRDSTVAPFGVPYPGLAVCPTLDCTRGSAMPPAQAQSLIQHAVELAKAQSTTAIDTLLPLGSYEYAGKYTYGDLSSLTLSHGYTTCSTGIPGTFRTLVGPTTYDKAKVYLGNNLSYGQYDTSSDASPYMWDIGTPIAACDGSGAMPSTLMGNWDSQYGPFLRDSSGAHSVWVRGDEGFRSCKQILAAGQSVGSGVYTINPDGQPLQVYCDMVTAGGGWTLTYLVDANHFDGIYLDNYAVSSLPPSGLNASSDIWNVEQSPGLTFGETLMACTQDTSGPAYYWSYGSTTPQQAFDSTTTDSGYINNFPSTGSNTTSAGCIAAHKYGTYYGFAVLESNLSCGTCTGMLFGMYHYPAAVGATGCNITNTAAGDHPSPYDGRMVSYPICNGLQTSNGRFWIGVR